jgi:hypothetical protein
MVWRITIGLTSLRIADAAYVVGQSKFHCMVSWTCGSREKVKNKVEEGQGQGKGKVTS